MFTWSDRFNCIFENFIKRNVDFFHKQFVRTDIYIFYLYMSQTYDNMSRLEIDFVQFKKC